MRWFSTFFRKQVIERHLDKELRFHLQQQIDGYIAAGLTPDEARRKARFDFGGLDQIKEECRDVRPTRWIDDFGRDLRFGWRMLRRDPGFTTVALTVLALGIGAGTAVYSVADAVVLRGIPFDEHDRIAAVLSIDTKSPTTFGGGSTTTQTYLDWRRMQQSFEGLSLVGSGRFWLKTASGEPANATAQRVTWEFFPTLRVAPLLGRGFTKDDEIDGHDRVAVLSYGFWQRWYGGAPEVLGKTIDLNEEPWQIVGVMPRGFEYPVAAEHPTELYVSQVFKEQDRVRAGGRGYSSIVIGRLKPAITVAQANDEMNRIVKVLNKQYPDWEPGWRVQVVTLQEHLVGRVRGWMLMLLGAVVLVLLIACANVANLMLARVTVRSRELGIRAALGASRWRLVRGMLVESLVLSLTGGVLGIVTACAGVHVLRAWLPSNVPRVASIAIDMRVLGASIAAALLTGIFCGIVPALQSSRPDLANALKEGGRSSTPGGGGQRLRSVLVIAEVALAVVLLVGAGLFIGSFVKLMSVDMGFEYRNLLAIDVSVNYSPRKDARAAYDEASKRGQQYIDQMIEAVGRVHGVQMVGAVNGGVPLTNSWIRAGVSLAGRGDLKGDDRSIDRRMVTANYLQVLRVPLIRGRYLSEQDRQTSEPVVVINQCAARKYWPGRDAVGQRIKIGGKERIVVGIVGDIRHMGQNLPVRQEAYVPLAQERATGATLMARTSGDPLKILPAVKTAIWSVNRDQRIYGDTLTLEGYVDHLIAQRRFNMALLALFGLLGLVIAAVGIYGVMAYVVAQRTHEIGVRMALGATKYSVVSMIMLRASVLILSGLAVGAGGAWFLNSSVKAFLFEVQPNDMRIFLGALAVLAVAGLAASVVPAHRAAGIDPLVALRCE